MPRPIFIELLLKTREVYQLWQRPLDAARIFMDDFNTMSIQPLQIFTVFS